MTFTLSSTKVKTTRKEHICDGCFDRIPKGTSCNKYACIYEDNFCSGYTCNVCEAFINSPGFFANNRNGWEAGTLPEFMDYEAFKKSYNEQHNRFSKVLTGSIHIST
jgi:hypothetical protein